MSELTTTEYREVREIWDSVTSREEGLAQVLAYWTKKYDTLHADNERLREALEGVFFLLQAISTSRKGSIGSIDNTYLPQLKRKWVDQLLQEVNAALAANVCIHTEDNPIEFCRKCDPNED